MDTGLVRTPPPQSNPPYPTQQNPAQPNPTPNPNPATLPPPAEKSKPKPVPYDSLVKQRRDSTQRTDSLTQVR